MRNGYQSTLTLMVVIEVGEVEMGRWERGGGVEAAVEVEAAEAVVQ